MSVMSSPTFRRSRFHFSPNLCEIIYSFVLRHLRHCVSRMLYMWHNLLYNETIHVCWRFHWGWCSFGFGSLTLRWSCRKEKWNKITITYLGHLIRLCNSLFEDAVRSRDEKITQRARSITTNSINILSVTWRCDSTGCRIGDNTKLT